MYIQECVRVCVRVCMSMVLHVLSCNDEVININKNTKLTFMAFLCNGL